MEIWRHLKTGSLYLVIGEATCSTNGALEEGQPAVVYYSLTYQRWFYRRASEFYDGRFVKVDAPEWQGKQKTHGVQIITGVCDICDRRYEYCICPVACPECEGASVGMHFDCKACGGTGRYEK